jgi:hypothetical protein
MYSHRAFPRRPVAWLSIAMLLCAPGSGLSALMQTAAKPAPATKPAAAKPAPASPDGAWPRTYLNNAGTVVLYQPQISKWDGQKVLELYAAASFKPAGKDKAMLGTVIAEAETRVSIDERLVDFSKFRVTQSNFPGASKEETAAAVAAITMSIPAADRVIALDRVLASFDSSQIRPKNLTDLKADPPVVFYSTKPAALVNLDGEPVWSPIANNDLRYAVNTNWDLFEHQPTKTFYLRHDKIWLRAAAFKGPWTLADQLPASFTKLPADENWKDVRAALPLKKPGATALPAVFVSTTPAELILLKGAPAYHGVTGTKLLWISNTESDVFRLGSTGPVYYLVAGRWFSSPGFTGPWTFATPTLPDEFKKIPLEHERSRVLASVPGTTQAAEAVLLAQVPNTARINKKEIKAPEVAYQGEPKFEAIPTTTVARAANTDKDIIKVGDLYYMCYQGVWFMSRSASGPWTVAETIPKEIYEIPVSSPSHNVTYVTIEDDDDDDWVVFATAAAYTGVMIGWGCAVWGSGYYYPPYVGYGGFYPAYYPHYPTYGYGASYNPWTGAYSRGMVAYGPYGGAGVGARYNPRTGTYSRGAAAYGPYGSRGAASAYNPRTGAVGTTRQGSNVYGSWGSTAVQRGDNWATTSRATSNITGNTTRVTQGSNGGAAVTRNTPGPGGGGVAQTGNGDVYAGKDGNVYRKGSDGSWQQYDGGGWNSGAQPKDRAASGANSGTVNDLNRESAARAEGAQRTRDASTARSGGSSGASSGTYRPSGGARSSGGGGARAGGGGRRR